jgi:hypothetical protein
MVIIRRPFKRPSLESQQLKRGRVDRQGGFDPLKTNTFLSLTARFTQNFCSRVHVFLLARFFEHIDY